MFKFKLLIFSAIFAFCATAWAHSDQWDHCVKRTKAEEIKLKHARGFKLAIRDQLRVIKSDQVYTIGPTKKSPCRKVLHIQSPIQGLALTAGPQVAFLELLGLTDKITAFSQGKYIFHQQVKQAYESKKIREISSPIHMETLIKAAPDLILTSFGELTRSQKRQLEREHILAVAIFEYRETSALGRAEWLKFFGAIFGVLEKSMKRFDQIEKEYLKISSQIKQVELRPTVLVGANFKGRWAAPSPESDFSQLIADAGGRYLWKKEKSEQRLQIPFEKVLKDATRAEIWLTQTNDKKFSDILAEDSRYASIKSVVGKKVFSFSKRINESGANDYWETGVVRPDLVLKDLAKIFQPALFKEHEFIWYRPLDD